MEIEGAKFELGEIGASPAAMDALERTDTDHRKLIEMHAHCEHGIVNEPRLIANQKALAKGAPIISSYALSDGTVVIVSTDITCGNDKYPVGTVIVLLDEYEE